MAADRVFNCFLLDGNSILIVMGLSIILMDKDLEILQGPISIKDSNDRINKVTCYSSGIESDNNINFLLAVDVDINLADDEY